MPRSHRRGTQAASPWSHRGDFPARERAPISGKLAAPETQAPPSNHGSRLPYLELGLDLAGFATSQHLDVAGDLWQGEKAPVPVSRTARAPQALGAQPRLCMD